MKPHLARWAPLATGLLLIVGVAATQQAAPRIGLVNLQVIMEQTPGYAEARDTFNQLLTGYQQEMEGLQATYDSMVRAYDQQQVVLSPTARQEKLEQVRQFQARMAQRAQQLDETSTTEQRRLLEPLEERVQTVIDGLRAERNLAIVFDVGTAGNIVSADRTLDMTQLVIDRLRSAQ